MRWLRATTQFVAVAGCLGLGVLLILEATGVVTDAWRLSIADGIAQVATETPLRWAYALAGVGLACVALTLATAQVLPARRGMTVMLPVSDGHTGATVLRGKALIAAVQHRIADVLGVVDSTTWLSTKQITVEVRVDDRSDVQFISDVVRSRLDHGFWIDMGVADLPVNIRIVHHPNPPRVR